MKLYFPLYNSSTKFNNDFITYKGCYSYLVSHAHEVNPFIEITTQLYHHALSHGKNLKRIPS